MPNDIDTGDTSIGGINERVLDRVRKLLAKAEHPATPPAEAEAFSVKAAELMARHLIDEAVLDAGRLSSSQPEVRTLEVEPPYARARGTLLNNIARAHRVTAVLRDAAPGGGLRVSLVGFRSDLAATELLFTSLLLQASTAMLLASAGASSPKAFRRAFLIGYAATIGARLAEVTSRVAAEQPTATGASTALVLADRSAAVEALVQASFPRLRTIRTTVSDRGGLTAGQQAGQRADLGTGKPLRSRTAAITG
jgi:hypothetical protein